jgi:sigma-B regulation protein RsbU (phosphoserine phosphatase)
MDAEVLRNIPAIQEFFGIASDCGLKEETRLILEAMEEVHIGKGSDIVTFGAECDDGMYIILSGTTQVLDAKGNLINTLGVGDFIGELGLINDNKRGATVCAACDVVCANISKSLFNEIAGKNRKIYGTFMNMLYMKTTRLVTERERIKSELAVAAKIQAECLENDFSEFNRYENISFRASMRPAKEVGGDFYDVFMTDEEHMCFLIADVSGKGIPAALFMIMAKTHIKNYAMLNLPLCEVAERVNNQLCYKNETDMFVTAFICVLDIATDEVTFVNAGHNRPFITDRNEKFVMLPAKANPALGMLEGVKYTEQHFELPQGRCLYMYTDGITEALNPAQEFFGNKNLQEALNKHIDKAGDVDKFIECIYNEVDAFADGEQQADDITMVCLNRN